jgi:methylmalonyl-CoA mutase N-terminal domain/subunit
LAAVLGGTQSLHTDSYDEAMGLPTSEAAAIALRTQQIIAFESGSADTADPLAGSYFVETLTNEIEKKALEIINKIDIMGGSVVAIEQGYMQNEIARSAYEYQHKIETGEKIIVSVNKFQTEEEGFTPTFKIDDSIRLLQIEKLKKLKSRRDPEKVKLALQKINNAATANTNLMPVVIEAVENLCTLGEIADELRKVFGEFK